MSLRNYLSKSELVSRLECLNNTSDVSDEKLLKAEQDIDNAVAYFVEGAFSKIMRLEEVYQKSNCTWTNTTLTISNINPNNNRYEFTVIEVLGGAKNGTKILVTGNTSNVLTFTAQTDLDSYEGAVKIYQLGKFPMKKDYFSETGIDYKTLPDWLKDAVAFQYDFIKNQKTLSNQKIKSKQVNRTDYTIDYGENKTVQDYVDPRAWSILESQGLTTQTL